MIALIQRVTCGQVEIDNQTVAKIDQGVVALVAIEKNDTDRQVAGMFERMVNYRIFADNTGRMNLSLLDVNGGLILVPQFTLVADTRRGNRPDFSDNLQAASARDFFKPPDALCQPAISPRSTWHFRRATCR